MDVEAASYGTLPGWIGRRVDVQWNDLFVRLIDPHTGQLLRQQREPRAGSIGARRPSAPRLYAVEDGRAIRVDVHAEARCSREWPRESSKIIYGGNKSRLVGRLPIHSGAESGVFIE